MLDFYWSRLLPITLLAIIPIGIWGIVDLLKLARQGGYNLKRGVKIASKSLHPEIYSFLESLQEDVIEKRKLLFMEITAGFIQINGYERLILIRKEKSNTAWPYVGYIDFSQQTPTLEFRASLPSHLILLPVLMTGYGIPLVALLMFFNYRQQTKTIEEFIQKQKIALES